METLSASEAATILRLHVKHVQRLARAGRLPASRVGRKWLFRRADLEALLRAGAAPAADGPVLDLSARNQLRGRIVSVTADGVMAEVRLRIGDQDLISIITRSSAERMRLVAGDTVYAVIKSTEVMIGKA